MVSISGRAHAGRGLGRRAQAQARGHEGRAGVVGDGVAVAGDAGPVEHLLGLLAGQLGVEGAQVDQDHVVVGAPGDQAEALGHQGVAQGARRWPPPGRRSRRNSGRAASAKATALAAMTCSSGPPWRPGKTALSIFLASSAPQRMAPPRGPRRVLWVVRVTTSATPTGLGWAPPAIRPAGWAASNMKQRAHRVGDLPEGPGVDDAGVGGGAGHDEVRLLALGQVGHLVEVDDLAGPSGIVAGRRDAVGHEAPDLRGDRGRRAVGQVAAVVEPHGQDGGARLEEGLVDGQIGVGPGMGLHVGVVGPEEGGGTVPGQVLDLVDDLVAAVVALPGVALGVLVGEHRTGGGQHGGRGEVLRGDELQRGLLATFLLVDEAGDLGISVRAASSQLMRSSRRGRPPRAPASAQLAVGNHHRGAPGVVRARDAHWGESTEAPGTAPGVSRYAPPAMALDPRTPVVVGVGQVTVHPDPDVDPGRRGPSRSTSWSGPCEAAAEDCDGVAAGAAAAAGAALIRRAESIRVVAPLGWRTVNPALLVAERLGFTDDAMPRELMLSAIGGNTPQAMMHDACRAIAPGRPRRGAGHRGRGHVHPDRVPPRPGQGPPGLGQPGRRGHARAHGVRGRPGRGHRPRDVPRRHAPHSRLPALRERAAGGRRVDAGRARRRASVPSGRASARWPPPTPTPGSAAPAPPRRSHSPARTTAWCRSPTPSCARPTCRWTRVRATSCARSRRPARPGCPRSAGSSRSSGADANDHWFISHRPELHRSPAIRLAGQAALELAGLGIDDVGPVDLYSCFPAVVQMAAHELGLPIDDPARPLTLTGGLTFGGGPGNNYTSHGIAQVGGGAAPGSGRRRPGHRAGLVRHQALGRPVRLAPARPRPSAGATCRREVDALPQCGVDAGATGPVRIETYTVTFGRDGHPERGIVACRTADDSRAWGNIDRRRHPRRPLHRGGHRTLGHPRRRRHPRPPLTPAARRMVAHA